MVEINKCSENIWTGNKHCLLTSAITFHSLSKNKISGLLVVVFLVVDTRFYKTNSLNFVNFVWNDIHKFLQSYQSTLKEQSHAGR